jgi:hypothetical protein
MDDYPKLSSDLWKEQMKPTCGETEERKEGNGNPFRGNIVVLELLLVVIGAVRGTFRWFRN